MEDEKKMILFDSILVQLNKVEYLKLEDTSKHYNILTNDKITSKNVSELGFNLLVSRKLMLDPEGAFKLFVQFELECLFDSDARSYYLGDVNKINKFINKRKLEIVESTEVGNLITILISQLTLVNNGRSIITAPTFRPE
jgi:hypothetical protein